MQQTGSPPQWQQAQHDEWTAWREKVKAAVDLREVMRPYLQCVKGEHRPKSFEARCPFHNDTGRANLAVYADNYKCYGCEAHGDLFDWIEAPEGMGMSKADALGEAERLSGVPRPEKPQGDRVQVRTATIPQAGMNIPAFVAEAHKSLKDEESDLAEKARAYVKARGLVDLVDALSLGVITDEAAARLNLDSKERFKWIGRLVVPYHMDGRAVHLIARALNGQNPKYMLPMGSSPAPFNADALEVAKKNGLLILTEGEIDAASILAALGHDAPVIGLQGGHLAAAWLTKLAGVKCYILMDSDNAGKGHAQKLIDDISAKGGRPRRLEWTKAQDVNDYLQANGPEALAQYLAELIEQADGQIQEQISDLSFIQVGFYDEIETRANRPHSVYETGLKSLDTLLDGGFGEGLHVLGGVPGGGKTAFSLQMAAHNAKAGRPVLFVSYEQSRFELWARLAAGLTDIPVGAFKKGIYHTANSPDLDLADFLKKERTANMATLEAIARNLAIVEGDGGAMSDDASRWLIPNIRSRAEELAEAYDMPPLVILDYLQRMPAPEKHDRKELRERVAVTASSLQVDLARGVGCPVLVLSSLGRASYGSGQRKDNDSPEAMLSAFKEAGEVEYSAYTATLIYRLPELEASQRNLAPSKFSFEPEYTPLSLQVVKNREGKTGRAFAKFHGQQGRFTDGGLDDGK